MTAIEEQARSIFLGALERAPAHWPTYVADACGGNPELLARVEQLLRTHQAMGSIHGGGDESPPATILHATREGPGTVIGPFKVLQQLGEGGMGTVFMAEQSQPVQRKVALKIIKPGMDSRQVVARFEAERQALALMDHPNIAKVLDAGTTESGRPYFVMELVKGVSITRYCDEHRLTPKQRLELFVPVCQAVQHAHQKGVIHRDLKPSNVLVAEFDEKPVAKVIDFGVAKATGAKLTERTMFTELGQIVGTLEYMSPEQAKLNALDIDTRSDIYALGVLLYELMTGTTPLEKNRFRRAAFDEMLRIIREEEPPKPSTRLSTTDELPSIAANRGLEPKRLSGLMRGELDWIVMKALEKDRNRRYETANGFAQDIQRYLADEAVQACPPSAAYRLRKFTRRNKGGLVTAALVMAALLVGTTVSTWQAIRATDALENERRTRAALDQERTQVNGKIGDRLLEVAALREKASAAGPTDGKHWGDLQDAARRAEILTSSDLADPALVERVRGLLEQVRQDEKNRRMTVRLEEIRLDRLAAQSGTRASPHIGSDFAAAFREYGLPMADLPASEAAGRVRNSAVRDDLLSGLDVWSVWDAQNGGTAWKHLLTVAQAADDHSWRRECRDTVLRGDRPALVQLARREDSPRQQAEAVLFLAGVLAVPSPDQAATDEELSVAAILLEKAGVWRPENMSFRFALAAWIPETSRVIDNVALVSESIERLTTIGASVEVLGAAYFELGKLLEKKNDSAGVAAACRHAVRLMPDRTEYWKLLLGHIGNDDERIAECTTWIRAGPPDPLPYQVRAGIYSSRQQWPEMLADYTKWTELTPDDASAWGWRAQAYISMKQYGEALAAFTKAIEIRQRAGQNPARFWHGRACTYRMLGERDKAIADSTKAVELDPSQGVYWVYRGDSYRDKGDLERAEADYEMAVKNPSPGNLNLGLYRRAELNERLGRWDRAISDWAEQVKRDPSNRYNYAVLFRLLITCPDRALRDPRRALAMDKEDGPFLADQPDRWRLLGIAHYDLREWKEAIAALNKVADREPDVGFSPDAGFYLAMAHWHLGNHDEASKYYNRTVQMIVEKPQGKQYDELWDEAKELMTTQKKRE